MKLMTAATVILGLVMIVITVTLAFTATNGAAAFVLVVLSLVLVGCVLAALDWGNSWHEAAMYAKGLMEGTASKMTAIKENTMSYCERNCPLPFHTCGLEEEVFEDFYAEEALGIMIAEAECAQEMMDEHYVGAHHNDLQVGCPDCDAIKTHIPAPPTEDDYPF